VEQITVEVEGEMVTGYLEIIKVDARTESFNIHYANKIHQDSSILKLGSGIQMRIHALSELTEMIKRNRGEL